MSHEKLISSNIISLTKLNTNIRVRKAIPDLPPITRIDHVIPQPTRKPAQPVLFVRPSRNRIASVGSGHDEGEDQDGKEKDNQYGHTKEVKGQEAFFVPVGADESGQRDKEDEESDEDDRPPEHVDALVVRLGSQPYSGADYGN